MPILPLLPILAGTPIPRPGTTAQSTLQTPDGWTLRPLKDGQVGYAPNDLATGHLAGIIFWPEETAEGDLDAWFRKKAPQMGSSGGKFQTANGVVFTTGVNRGRPFILAAVRPKGASSRARVGMLFGTAEELETYGSAFADLITQIATGSRPRNPGSGGSGVKSTGGGKKSSREDLDWADLPASDASKPLPAASLNGAKVFIIYKQSYGMSGMEVRTDALVLFPDGTAFDEAPSKPVAVFDAAHIRAIHRPMDTGRWSMTGDKLTITYPQRTRYATTVYRKVGEGWTDDKDANANSAWNVYRRVVEPTKAKLLGAWHTSSLTTMGTMGGGAPMVAAGSSGDLAFADSTYSDATSRFASATTSNMGDAFKTGDVTTTSSGKGGGAGRYRLDGILLTRERNGKRGVELAFLMPKYDGDDPKTLMIGRSRYERPGRKK